MSAPSVTGIQVVGTPQRVGSELRWNVRLADGAPGVMGQLLPELARDESIRRRYVRDVERVRSIQVPGLAAVVELGPPPDPRDPAAPPPFRVREDPPGTALEAWLDERAPLPVEDACELVAKLALVVHGVHEHGAVVRNLNPRHVVVGDDEAVWLTDVGLARVEVLSTRTAASLVLEGSPYASPEQLTRTVVDQRSDLYGLGVILFRALTGALPFGDQPALLRDVDAPVVGPTQLRPDVPVTIDAVVRRCLDAEPARRPDSARELAEILRGKPVDTGADVARVQCQSCGAALRPGQRLCHSCAKLAVQFELAPPNAGHSVVLRKVKEDAGYLAGLRGFLASVADAEVPRLNFLVGDARMYSKEERKRLIRLPATIAAGLTHETANAIQSRLGAIGIKAVVKEDSAMKRRAARTKTWAGIAVGVVLITLALAAALGSGVLAMFGVFFAIAGAIAVGALSRRKGKPPKPALVQLRKAPAALPASDPLVRHLADSMNAETRADVREQIGELALLVQQLVDHRIRNAAEQAEIDVVTAPMRDLVDLVVRQVQTVQRVDHELAKLDEGTMVRSLAAAEARKRPDSERRPILDDLDHLRHLEDERAQAFHRLLETSALLRRAIGLGMAVHDDELAHERQVELAFAALGGGGQGESGP